MNKLLVLALVGLLNWPASAHYNEIRDEDGRVRPEYAPLADFLDNASPADLKRFERLSTEAFDGDNALDPIPRILNEKEFAFLKKAVDQRARAILAFLKDHYSEKKSYLKARVVPEEVVTRALSRAGELGYDGLLRPEDIAFHYGPDIVRGEIDGRVEWYVLEDNTGYVGGLGDLVLSQELILDLHPQLAKTYQLNDPMNYYRDLARKFRQAAARKGGKAVLFRSAGAEDNEGARVESLMGSFGIEVISPQAGGRMFVEDGDVFIHKNGQREKVGAIILEDELSWVDRTHPASADKHILDLARLFIDPGVASAEAQDEVRKILGRIDPRTGTPSVDKLRRIMHEAGFTKPTRSLVPGLVEAIARGRVAINNTPGTDFVSDKEIYLYTNNMIRHYLNERPLVKTVPSFTLVNETGELDQQRLRDVLNSIQNWVIKRFDGRGGGAVWVGNKLKPSEVKKLESQILSDPSSYKVQRRLEISRMDEDIVDLRLHAHMMNDQVLVADTPWGRGAPASGNGKVNIGSKGHVVTVLVGRRCEEALKSKRRH